MLFSDGFDEYLFQSHNINDKRAMIWISDVISNCLPRPLRPRILVFFRKGASLPESSMTRWMAKSSVILASIKTAPINFNHLTEKLI